MPSIYIKTGNKLRQDYEKGLLIILKLSKKLGGFDKLAEYGLTAEEIKFLKEEFKRG